MRESKIDREERYRRKTESIIAGIVRRYTHDFEPTGVFVDVKNRTALVERVKELKAGGPIAYEFGVRANYPFNGDSVKVFFSYWNRNELLQTSAILDSLESFEILQFIIYPHELFGSLLWQCENLGYFKSLNYGGKPLVINKW